MSMQPEERYRVDFPVFLSWQQNNGSIQRVQARCVDLSPSGARLEITVRPDPGAMIAVQSEQFGRMGLASIRYCNRSGAKYSVGLEFSTLLRLSDPVSKNILGKVLRPATTTRR